MHQRSGNHPSQPSFPTRRSSDLHPGDYDLVVNGTKNESDLAQQVALVEQMIASGVNALVIAPADSRALVRSEERRVGKEGRRGWAGGRGEGGEKRRMGDGEKEKG